MAAGAACALRLLEPNALLVAGAVLGFVFAIGLAPSAIKQFDAPFRPCLVFSESSTSEHPPPSPDSPHASNRPPAPRSGGPQPLGRSGELGTMPPDAPVASTPPRRREPGR